VWPDGPGIYAVFFADTAGLMSRFGDHIYTAAHDSFVCRPATWRYPTIH
jgi:hypothetical protein